MSQIKHYYAGSNSSQGFYSFYEEALKGLDPLFILKGGPGTGKSTLIKQVGDAFEKEGWEIEFLHCSSDNDSLDGVIIPKLNSGIVDGTAPHVVDPKYPGAVDRIVNLGDCRDDSLLVTHKKEIIELTDSISETFSKAYDLFASAKKAHDDMEALYLSAMDFGKADEVTEDLIQKIFAESLEAEQNPAVRHLFFGAATPKGPVHFIDNLTDGLNKRYIVKGRAGSGKSTMMKKVGRYAEEKGLSVQYFHCAFDPESCDMVVIPSLSTAVLDGTAPHVIDPSRTNDEVVDMFELCIDTNIETDRAEELRAAETPYKTLMNQGTDLLMEAKQKHDQLETFYIQAMDFEAVEQKRDQIITELQKCIRDNQVL
ncbi:MAG TPA: PRK06851 family protein [Bacillales bacterium]|nr:PRK06851 family protein [Bacillales bacterium]